jgi:hypothetical protein
MFEGINKFLSREKGLRGYGRANARQAERAERAALGTENSNPSIKGSGGSTYSVPYSLLIARGESRRAYNKSEARLKAHAKHRRDIYSAALTIARG